jgi:hypothetical protein
VVIAPIAFHSLPLTLALSVAGTLYLGWQFDKGEKRRQRILAEK